MKLTPWMVVLSLSLVSCSGSKSAQNVDQETPQVELSNADEYIDNLAEEPEAPVEEVVEATTLEEVPVQEVASSEPIVEDVTAPVVTESAVSGTEQVYTVQKNETLMIVAFKLYGDYHKWKELANYNADTLKGNLSVKAGTKLKYLAPAEEFVWNPEGLPYLIRTGDTLGRISKTVYTTEKKWKLIWDNNRPLIKDPNRIFAGFTLYYLENGREVAAEL